MNAFIRLTPEERYSACMQVKELMHLQAVSVEKDFWVCWTLRELFTLPAIGDRLTFKGGTSLSKAWQIIQRFSEDIEIFFRFSWVDYSTHKPGTFRLTPPTDHLADWQSDYQAMLGPMFFGDTPTFAQIMAAATTFETTFNATASTDHRPPTAVH